MNALRGYTARLLARGGGGIRVFVAIECREGLALVPRAESRRKLANQSRIDHRDSVIADRTIHRRALLFFGARFRTLLSGRNVSDPLSLIDLRPLPVEKWCRRGRKPSVADEIRRFQALDHVPR